MHEQRKLRNIMHIIEVVTNNADHLNSKKGLGVLIGILPEVIPR